MASDEVGKRVCFFVIAIENVASYLVLPCFFIGCNLTLTTDRHDETQWPYVACQLLHLHRSGMLYLVFRRSVCVCDYLNDSVCVHVRLCAGIDWGRAGT
jgi:hypothetical protein